VSEMDLFTPDEPTEIDAQIARITGGQPLTAVTIGPMIDDLVDLQESLEEGGRDWRAIAGVLGGLYGIREGNGW
jgi:hypothetical protein